MSVEITAVPVPADLRQAGAHPFAEMTTVFHSPSPSRGRGSDACDGTCPHRCRWHLGQKCDPRFMKFSRTIGVPQRGHGAPCRPYAFSE